jgi:pimeloyl-ACP methyl ester carboxylesterase
MKKRPASPFVLPHADDLVGALSLIGKRLSRPVQNTLRDADVYRGVAHDILFPTPKKIPAVRVQRRWQLPNLVSEDLVFRSAHRPLEPKFRKRYRDEYRETHTVYARRIRPPAQSERPRLIYLHGYMQPESYVEELTLLAGMALYLDMEIVQPQPPYHGRRTPASSILGGEFYWTADLVRSVESLRQTLLDARTLLSWMLREDSRPVGVMGLSLGGALAAILTCLEPRFHFSIPLIAHMDLDALVAGAPVMSGTRRDLRRFGWRRQDFARFVADLGWSDLRPQLAPDRIQLFAASDDRFFDPDVVRKMWRDWGEPRIRWYRSSHMGFLPHLPNVLAEVREFIDGLS